MSTQGILVGVGTAALRLGLNLEWLGASLGPALVIADDRPGIRYAYGLLPDSNVRTVASTGLLPSLTLRIGPQSLHLIAALRASGMTPRVADLMMAGVRVGILNVSGNVFTIGLSGGQDLSERFFVDAGISSVFAGAAKKLGWSFEARAQGDGVRAIVAVDVHWRGPPEPPDVLAKPLPEHQPVSPPALPPAYLSDPSRILSVGTILTLRSSPLRVLEGTDAPQLSTTLCAVDERAEAGGVTWLHLTCAPDLPADWPMPWRTGCYALQDDGVWRMPRCPAEGPTKGASSPTLVWPRQMTESTPGFVDIGQRDPETRKLPFRGAAIDVTCFARDLDGTNEVCFNKDFGLVWSAWRWRGRPSSRPELAVTLVDIKGEGAVDEAAPHLQFRNEASALCEMAPGCQVFGLCRAAGGSCIAASDRDCADANVCVRAGRCHAKAGACAVGGDKDCRASTGCRDDGRCSARDGVCTVGPADCQGAAVCRNDARCTRIANSCALVSAGDCARSLLCSRDGLCSLDAGRCKALSSEDCSLSEACLLRERCVPRDGECGLPAESTLPAPAHK